MHTFPLKALLSEDADKSEELCDLFQIKHCGVVKLDNSQRLLVIGTATAILHQPTKKKTERKSPLKFAQRGYKHCQNIIQSFSPINAGDINDNIYHITAEFVGLHVHRRAVGGDVNLANNIKEESFLDPRMLQNTEDTDKNRYEQDRLFSVAKGQNKTTYRDKNVQKVLQRW